MLAHEFRTSACGATCRDAIRDTLPIQFCPKRIQLEINFPTADSGNRQPSPTQVASSEFVGDLQPEVAATVSRRALNNILVTHL
jgi:hypothetical protein